MNRRIGVLLAAGRGRRMGGRKLLLPWPPAGTTTVVESSFGVVAEICTDMVVVVAHDDPAVRLVLNSPRITFVEVDGDAPMFDSVRAGLAAAQAVDRHAEVLLLPADMPNVDPSTVRVLCNADRGDRLAIIPTFQGKGGHPVRIFPGGIEAALAWPGIGGLRTLWSTHEDRVHRLELGDESVLQDIDFPSDYARLSEPR